MNHDLPAPGEHDPRPVLIRAAGAFDARGRGWAPAGLLLGVRPGPWTGRWPFEERPEIIGRLTLLEVGPFDVVRRGPRALGARVVERPDAIITPALVNPHAHLDLTPLGPMPAMRGDFPGFLRAVRDQRPQEGPDIAAAVRLGVERSLAGGVVAVGDIAGCPASGPTLTPWLTLRGLPIAGVSFAEFFAIGRGEARGLEAIGAAVDRWLGERRPGDAVAMGLQPHAPYSVSARAYAHAADLAARAGLRLSTHLAESLAEREFVASGTGPHRELLERLGVWEASLARDLGSGRTPIDHLLGEGSPVRGARPMVVHCNDVTDGDIAVLAESGATVAYCPRSSAFFDADRTLGPHRWRELRARGVPVIFGTDSMLNLDTPDRISPIDDLRLLARTHPLDLGAFAGITADAAASLGLNPRGFELAAGNATAGLCAFTAPERLRPAHANESTAVSLLQAVLGADSPPSLLAHGNPCDVAGTDGVG
ncbi:MAG: amidohydrolase family protein [Phycisphaeraceae bacterium]|nr:MAG: amidohydrolase family protein [Phycisphaeraceae bacterium]